MTKKVSIRLKTEADTRGLDEYNRKIGEAAKKTQQSKKEIQDASGAFDTALGFMQARLISFGVTGAIDTAQAMLTTGRTVNTASDAFVAYGSKIGNAADMLRTLRQATGGVIDDLTLTSNGAALMGLEIAKTSDDLVTMISSVSKLASLSPGQTLAEGMDSFVRVMKNGVMSIELLDNIGIKASRVKELVQQMGKPLSDQDAFNAAVMQTMQEKLDSLGGAADRGATAYNRLLTAATNFYNQASSNFATGVEATLGLVEYGLGMNPYQVQGREQAAAFWNGFRAELQGLGTEGAEALFKIDANMYGLGEEEGGKFLQGVFDTWKNAPEQQQFSILVNAISRMQNSVGQMPITGLALDTSTRALERLFFSLTANEYAASQLRAIGDAVEYLKTKMTSLGQVISNRANSAQIYQTMIDPLRDMIGLFGQVDNYALPDRLFTEAWTPKTVKSFVPDYLTQSRSENAQAQLDYILKQYDRYKADFESGLITQEQLDQMKTAADNAKLLADEAKRAADNFAKITLKELFGQGGGGVLGEWFDVVTGGMPVVPEFTQRTFDLISGKETELSLVIQDQVNPYLRNLAKTDPALAARAMQAMQTSLESITLAGGTMQAKINAVMFVLNQIKATPPTGSGAGTFTITAGMTASEAAAAAGMSVDELINTYGFGDTRHVIAGTYTLPPAGGGMGGGGMGLKELSPESQALYRDFMQYTPPLMQPFEQSVTVAATEGGAFNDNMTAAEQHVLSIERSFAALTGKVQDIKVRFMVVGTPQWLTTLMIEKKIIVETEFVQDNTSRFGETSLTDGNNVGVTR